MEIRLLLKADAVEYSVLWKDALVAQNEYFRISIENEPSPQIQTKFSDESFSLGVFIDAKLVGTVSLERDSRAKLNHKALLFRMFIHSDYAGQGIGKLLLKETITLAVKIEGLKQIYLTVLASNERAVGLYKSMGFVTFSHEPKSVKINDQFVDELQMVHFFNLSNF